MIRIMYIPPGPLNSSELLLKEAVKGFVPPDYSSVLYIAPSPAKVQDAQKIFHKLQEKKCYIPPHMGTLGAYCKRIYAACGDQKILGSSLIPLVLSGLSGKGPGYASVLSDFIHDLKQWYPGSDTAELRDIFSTAFRELSISDSVAGAVMKALETFSDYQAFLKEKRLVDGDDIIRECPGLLLQECFGVGGEGTLVLDGFYDPSVAETDMIVALARRAKETLIAIPCAAPVQSLAERFRAFLSAAFPAEEVVLQKDVTAAPEAGLFEELPVEMPALTYCAYSDSEEEVEGIARNIKTLFVSGKFRKLEEMVVTFPNLHKYSAMVERVFGRYGIPYNLSSGRPLGKLGPFLDLLCLTSSVSEGYPRLKFSQFLASRHFGRIPASLKKWVPSLSLLSGIVAGKTAWLAFISEGSEVLDVSLMLQRDAVERDLRWIFKKLQPLEELKDGASFGTYAQVLGALLEDLAFPGPLSDAGSKKLYEATRDVLAQLAFLGELRPEPVALSRFEEALRHILNKTYVEEEGTGVRVMGFFELQGLTPHYLFCGGLADGELPGRQDMDYILPDQVKKRMGFLHLQKFSDIQKFIFISMVKSCRKAHLSYPLMSGNEVFLPSSFLYSGDEVRESIPGIFSLEEHLVGSGGEPFLRHIAEVAVTPSLLPSSALLRVTDIDAYRTCPRRFFIERILRLKPLAIKEYEIEATTVGIILHKLMERLLREPFADCPTVQRRAGEIIDEIIRDRKLDEYWKLLLRDSFMEIVPDIFEKEHEIRGEGYLSTEVEISVTGEPVKGIHLKGKVDRIDHREDGVQIIDYKTGSPGLTCSQIVNGKESLQLLLYAAMLKERGQRVERVGIYSLKDIAVKWCPPRRRGTKGKDKKEESGLDDYIEASLHFLEEAVGRMRKGDFTAAPLNDQTCRKCHEYTFCPYIQQ